MFIKDSFNVWECSWWRSQQNCCMKGSQTQWARPCLVHLGCVPTCDRKVGTHVSGASRKRRGDRAFMLAHSQDPWECNPESKSASALPRRRANLQNYVHVGKMAFIGVILMLRPKVWGWNAGTGQWCRQIVGNGNWPVASPARWAQCVECPGVTCAPPFSLLIF